MGLKRRKRCKCNTESPSLTLAGQLLRNHRWETRASYPPLSQVVESLGHLRLLVRVWKFWAKTSCSHSSNNQSILYAGSLGRISFCFLFLVSLPLSDVSVPSSLCHPLFCACSQRLSLCKSGDCFLLPKTNVSSDFFFFKEECYFRIGLFSNVFFFGESHLTLASMFTRQRAL